MIREYPVRRKRRMAKRWLGVTAIAALWLVSCSHGTAITTSDDSTTDDDVKFEYGDIDDRRDSYGMGDPIIQEVNDESDPSASDSWALFDMIDLPGTGRQLEAAIQATSPERAPEETAEITMFRAERNGAVTVVWEVERYGRIWRTVRIVFEYCDKDAKWNITDSKISLVTEFRMPPELEEKLQERSKQGVE